MYPLLLEIYILYRANHNQTRLAPLPPFPFSFHSFSFFSFLSLSLEIYLLSCDDDVLHAFRGEARAQSRSGVDTRGKRGGGAPLLSKIKSLLLRPYVYATIVSWGGGWWSRVGVHLLESYDTRLREGVRAWAEQTATSDMCHSANKSSARTGSSTRNNYLFWERVFSSFFWRRGGGSSFNLSKLVTKQEIRNFRIWNLIYLYSLHVFYSFQPAVCSCLYRYYVLCIILFLH